MPYDEEDESRILFEMQCAMEDSARAEAEAASYEQAEAEAHSAYCRRDSHYPCRTSGIYTTFFT